ncbi:MAG: imelysin family protein [Flavobacteriales bacterium]
MKFYKILIIVAGLSVLSCKKEKDEPIPEFDKNSLLSNYGNNIIVPAYENLELAVSQLEAKTNDFISVPTAINLQGVRSQFLTTYEAWQSCSFMHFGPSDNYTLKQVFNTYPVDTTLINSNISSGSYILGSASNTAAIGLPALDFLLFPSEDVAVSLLKLNGANSGSRKQYIRDLVAQLKTAVNFTLSAWKTSYLSTFISSNGNGQGSSLSEIVNAMNLDFEKFTRDGKIGIPLGVRSLGTPIPEKTESFYSKHSLVLFKESILQLQNYFNGESAKKIGLDDYLNHLNDNNETERLAEKINTQFDMILQKANLITESISVAVNTEQAKVQDLYEEMQKMVVLLKVDLSSALSVLITYQDNDGD